MIQHWHSTCARLFAAGFVCALMMAATPALAKKYKAAASAAGFAIPAILSPTDVDLYRRAFSAARQGNFTVAQTLARSAGDPLLRASLEGELLLQPGYAGRTSADMSLWLQQNPELPQAQRIYAAAILSNASAPKPAELGNRWGQWQFRKPPRAATTLERNTARLAWDMYANGQIAPALHRAKGAFDSPTPDGAFALWVAGLAAWRLDDCAAASTYFSEAANKPAISNDMIAASNFWAARAGQQCGQFGTASDQLRIAANTGDTFYGLLASRLLGIRPDFTWTEQRLTAADWTKLSGSSTVRRLTALAQIGERGLADEELRNLWGRTSESNYTSALNLASSLQLWGAKLSIARRPPLAKRAPLSAYYPVPDWWSDSGSSVPKALVLAFMRQESAFRRDTVSRANARGPMQFLPSTAREIAQDNSITESDARLHDPEFAIRIGKTYLRQLAKSSITNGHLIKVTASYNAGPGNVRNWNGTMPAADPLLYLESIPLTETRDYVETVIKNYWMYQHRMGEPMTSLDSLARGEWPAFPGEKTRVTTAQITPTVQRVAYANR